MNFHTFSLKKLYKNDDIGFVDFGTPNFKTGDHLKRHMLTPSRFPTFFLHATQSFQKALGIVPHYSHTPHVMILLLLFYILIAKSPYPKKTKLKIDAPLFKTIDPVQASAPSIFKPSERKRLKLCARRRRAAER
jgi:hypothetical protein